MLNFSVLAFTKKDKHHFSIYFKQTLLTFKLSYGVELTCASTYSNGP